MSIEIWELMSYVVTVVGLPLAISVFILPKPFMRPATCS
jgi:hypothetical protein